MRLPIGPRECFAGIGDGDGATFQTAAGALIVMVGADRGASATMFVMVCSSVGWLALTRTLRAMSAGLAAPKCFFTVARIEGDHGATGNARFRQKRLRRQDLAAVLGDIDMGEHQRRVGGQRAQHLGCGALAEIVEAAAQGLAVVGYAGPSGGDARRLKAGGGAAARRNTVSTAAELSRSRI
jgi:hypothetical protein